MLLKKNACFCRDIWNRFLEFESNIGDLASIVKVEKRRSAVLGQVSLKYFAFLLNCVHSEIIPVLLTQQF